MEEVSKALGHRSIKTIFLPDFKAPRAHTAGGVYTIAQRPTPFSKFGETVIYRLGTRILGSITGGRGTLTFTGPDPTKTFTVSATSESGIEHHMWTSHGNDKSGPKSVIRYPVCSSR